MPRVLMAAVVAVLLLCRAAAQTDKDGESHRCVCTIDRPHPRRAPGAVGGEAAPPAAAVGVVRGPTVCGDWPDPLLPFALRVSVVWC